MVKFSPEPFSPRPYGALQEMVEQMSPGLTAWQKLHYLDPKAPGFCKKKDELFNQAMLDSMTGGGGGGLPMGGGGGALEPEIGPDGKPVKYEKKTIKQRTKEFLKNFKYQMLHGCDGSMGCYGPPPPEPPPIRPPLPVGRGIITPESVTRLDPHSNTVIASRNQLCRKAGGGTKDTIDMCTPTIIFKEKDILV